MQSLDKTAPYKGVRQTFRMLLTEAGGFRVTLRGFTAVFLGAGPAHAAYFSVYEYFKNAFGGNANDGLHHPIASGRRQHAPRHCDYAHGGGRVRDEMFLFVINC